MDRNTGELFSQDVRTWQQQLIRGVLLSLVFVGPLAVIGGSYYAYTTQTTEQIPFYLVAYGLLLVVTFWRRVPYAVKVGVFLALIYALGVLDFSQDGRGGSGRLFLLGLVSVAALFVSRRASVLIMIVALLTFVGFGVAYTMGWISIPPSQEVNSTDVSGWVSNTMVLLLLMILMLAGQSYLVPRLTAALEQSRRLTRDLEAQRADLERVVDERTATLARRARYLEATADVARGVSSVLDVRELLSLVVDLISERFDFYHTGLFLIDPSGEWAVLEAASSEGGQRMLARSHRLRLGQQGIVGIVAARGQSRIALDVGQDAVFFDNPDLPETRSEMALPLRVRGEVIGVLDVQSYEREAFSQEDARVLQTLADQVALAISNARLFDQVQESLDAERRAYGELSAEAWRALLREQPDLGFVKWGDVILPAAEEWETEAERVVESGRSLQRSDVALAVPIKSGDHVIAVLDAHLPAGSGAWTSEQIAVLESLAEQVSQALERARLYRDTQRRAARERLTREITDAVQRATDMESLMHIATEELARALGGTQAYMRMGVELLEPGSAQREEESEDAEA